jgi:DNA helicase-2/ATP-dependent DNA helicase PcrA
VGLVEGLLPHSRSWEDDDAMAEERRLFYVGITRAKDALYLTYPQMRMVYGYAEPSEPSRFLEGIPLELVEGDHPRAAANGGGMMVNRWEPAASPVSARFVAGMKVRHPRWGEGLVVGSRIKDGAELVDVVFDSVGLKRVDAVLARLERAP